MEKRAKKIKQRVRPTEYQMAVPTGEKMAWQLVGKRAGSWANIKVFEKYRGGKQERNKGEGAGVAEEE